MSLLNGLKTSDDESAAPMKITVGIISSLALVLSIVAIALELSPIEVEGGTPPTTQHTPTKTAVADVEHPAPQTTTSTAAEQGATVLLPARPAPVPREELEAEAAAVAERILKRMPDVPQALHVSAMLNAQLRRTAEAERLWRKCVELDPQTEHYYVNLAATVVDRGDSQQAVDTLHTAQQRGLDSADISHHLSSALANLGKLDEAVEVAESALEKNPQSAENWLVLGQSQLKLGQLESAEASLRRAVELGVHSKAVYYSLFNVYTRLGKPEEAAGFRETYSQFGEQAYEAQDRFEILSEAEARRICVSVLVESAALYRDAQQSEDAEHAALRALALQPEHSGACHLLAGLYGSQGRFADEHVIRQRLIELEANNLMNYLLAAKAVSLGGDQAKAKSYLKLAISFSPRSVNGYVAMAEFLIERRKPAESLWYIQHALTLEPSAEGYHLLAKAYRLLGRESDAQLAEAKARQPVPPTLSIDEFQN